MSRPVLSPLDDFPVHQTADVIRHVATSDRNFYDRYYFNCHPCSDEVFLVVGLGQYPNLGVTDGFAVARRGDEHRVVRASRELGADRMDTAVGPLRVEVLEGLQRLRVVLEPNEWGLAFDLTFEGAVPAVAEPRHFLRQFERVVFDTSRLAQTGRWSGSLQVGDRAYDVTPDTWWGSRDRSWGVRPVGEPEPPGIRASRAPDTFFWVYAVAQFADSSLLTIAQERADGSRLLEEAVRAWPTGSGRPPEPLGRVEHDLQFRPGTREVRRGTLRFVPAHGRPLEVDVEPVLPLHLMVGTGYGLEPDWRHGMYQGPLAVDGLVLDLASPEARPRLLGLTDSVARFAVDGAEGWGLFEFGLFGPHQRYGFAGWDDVAG